MIEVIQVSFDYEDKAILNKVNFRVMPGTLLHLHGQNGAGKTTLLKLLAGLLQPSQGAIRYQGGHLDARVACCYISHKAGVSQALTPREHYHFELHQEETTHPSFDTLIHELSLHGFEDVVCGLLSEGQRRRVSLFRLFTSKAPVWLLDEPLVALDKHSLGMLITRFKQQLNQGGSIILTSHQALPFWDMPYEDYQL